MKKDGYVYIYIFIYIYTSYICAIHTQKNYIKKKKKQGSRKNYFIFVVVVVVIYTAVTGIGLICPPGW